MTAYAVAVLNGEIVAGPHVRAACERHLADLEHGEARGLYFDREAAEDFFGFCEEVCTVLADGETAPFILTPTQRFITGSIFGWKRANGRRRFRTCYIEQGKGNGKTPLAAAVGLYGLVADGEERSEIYSASTKKDQAMIMFRDAVSMVNNSPELATNIVKSGGNPVWQLTYHPSSSFFKPIANDDGQSGPRPHFGLVDELHEVKDAYTIKMLAAGFKARTQPLLFMITNSGFDRTTICWEYHEHAIKVAAQEVEDDSFFALVCSLDDGDDPFTDESCWIKTNPELGVVIKDEYLRSRVQTAMMLPSDQNEVLRLNFCVWTDADKAWITTHAWERCEARPKHRKRDLVLADFKGERAWGGLDLSFSQDLTARALVFRESVAGQVHLYGFLKFWTPQKTLLERERRDRVPYTQWVRDGWMEATPGPVIPMAAVGRQLQQDAKDFDLQFFAFDRYRHKDLNERMMEAGFDPPMIEHPQGFRRASRLTHDEAARFGYYDERGEPHENPLWMPGSIEELETAIVEGRFWTPKHPVLRWNVASVMPRDDPAGTGNKVFDKRKATGRIDGAVALAMATGAAMARFNSAEGALDDFLRNPVMVT